MKASTAVDYLIDGFLILGGLSLAILAAGIAATITILGHHAGTAIAIRWHAPRLARDAEYYANAPINRRKEKP